MKKTLRWLCLTLALVLCLSLLPGRARAAEEDAANPTTDFVLVLDCSGSLEQSDPELLCLDACNMFVDMLPLENARISVIAFGYKDNGEYTYSAKYQVTHDRNRVHVITPLQEATTLKARGEVQENILSAVEKGSASSGTTLTPIGMAVLGAVDLLEVSGTADNNACIVLLSDGRLSSTSISNNQECVDTAIVSAKSHNWPIYCIELNYDGANDYDNDYWGARSVMTRLASETGAGEYGWLEAKSADEISKAFINIFNRFMAKGEGNISSLTANSTGLVETTVTIEELTSQANIVVTGASLTKVELVNTTDNSTRTIANDIEEANIVASVETGSYISINLVCPTPGDWIVRSYGDPNATITMYDCSIKELELVLLSDPVLDGSQIMSKNQTITFDAYFAYHGVSLLANNYYQLKQPKLLVTNTVTGQMQEFPMVSGANGYSYTLTLGDVGSGAYCVRARLDDTMFRNGVKYSDALYYSTENLTCEIIQSPMAPMTGYVGSQLPKVDLSQYISNPDRDALEYTLSCVSDRSLTFNYTIDDQDYLYLDTGMTPGTHELELTVQDGDMTEPLRLGLTLTVENRPVERHELPQVELWIDRYSFQEVPVTTSSVDLADFFYDPDGVELTFSGAACTHEALVSFSLDGSVLSVEPLAKGETQITFQVSDGVAVEEAALTVKVVSGKAIYWAENWIWYAIGLAITGIIVLLVLFLIANKKVKGNWTITIEEPDTYHSAKIEHLNIRANTRLGSKRSFLLKDLLVAVRPMMSGDSDYFSSAIPTSTAFDRIEMKGISGSRGCVLDNIPRNDPKIKISYNGGDRSSKFKVVSGKVVIRIEQANGFNLDITLRV